MKNIRYLILLGLIGFIVQGCYRDNEQELYRFSDSICDTSTVSYSSHISSILSKNCITCHNGPTAFGNPQVFLDNYSGVKTVAANGKLLNAILYLTKPMPPSGKMDYCNIAKIRVWINAGSPQN